MGEGVFELIGRVVREEAGRLGVRVNRIILFGSRARGGAREDSDYDILIIVEEAGWRERRKLSQAVRRRLRPILKTPLDILVYTASEIAWRARVEGSFENEVVEEGIPVG